jgi:micrococcal nuclease
MRGAPTKGTLGSVLLLVVVALLVLRPWEGDADAASGPGGTAAVVVRAVDGDTLEVELPDGERDDVRLIGVDTPETVKPDAPVECFGERASAFTHRITDGRRVRLLYDAERRDIYERLLAYVQLGSATPVRGERSVNAMLLRRGLARTLTIPPNDRFAPLFDRLALKAARAGRGLWGHCRP